MGRLCFSTGSPHYQTGGRTTDVLPHSGARPPGLLLARTVRGSPFHAGGSWNHLAIRAAARSSRTARHPAPDRAIGTDPALARDEQDARGGGSMSIYTIVLFVHIIGAFGYMLSIGAWLLI